MRFSSSPACESRPVRDWGKLKQDICEELRLAPGLPPARRSPLRKGDTQPYILGKRPPRRAGVQRSKRSTALLRRETSYLGAVGIPTGAHHFRRRRVAMLICSQPLTKGREEPTGPPSSRPYFFRARENLAKPFNINLSGCAILTTLLFRSVALSQRMSTHMEMSNRPAIEKIQAIPCPTCGA